MAQRRFRPGQPSPPVSEDHDYLHPKFSKSHGPALPFTPPERFPQQAASQQWQVVGSGTDGGQDYGNPEEYEMAQPTFYRDATRFRTPPIPISASPSGIRTRSGRAVGTPASSGVSSGTRFSNSPRPTKQRRNNKSNAEDPLVTDPLSVMTKDYDIPVADMMAYVSRNDHDRLAEADKKGKTPRPLNSFMCYRAAYKDRIKKWGKQGDNNQLISKVAGLSWAIEPDEVKEYYKGCAKIEAENHARAFPNYKFAPNKNPKKRAREDDDETDPEWDGSSNYSGTGNKRRRPGRQGGREIPRSLTTTPVDMYGHSTMRNPRLIPLETPMVDPWGRPLVYPPPYAGTPIQYIPQQHYTMPYPTSAPMPMHHHHQQDPSSQLIGMPAAAMDGMPQPMYVPKPEQPIDPGLDFDDGFGLPTHDGQLYEIYHQREHVIYGAEQHDQVVHPGEQMLSIPDDQEWAAIPQAGGAFDEELDRWGGV